MSVASKLIPSEVAAAVGVEPMLTGAEVASLLRITRQALNGWVRAKKFPAPIVAGAGKRLWPADVVRRHLAERQGGETR